MGEKGAETENEPNFSGSCRSEPNRTRTEKVRFVSVSEKELKTKRPQEICCKRRGNLIVF